MSKAEAKLQRLAIDGGVPVRAQLLPYGRQSIDESDIEAVVAVLRSAWLTTGPKVAEFEEAVAAAAGARFAVALSSGTAALHAAAFAAGLKPGDEAITSPLTFCATANCVLYQGATPVFADVCEDTLNLDPAAAEARITPRTRALLPVDYAGHPAEMSESLRLAERHGLVVIEDACHALGAVLDGKRVGSMAHMTVFSFHPVKHITTAEGGMVVTDSDPFAKRLRLFRNHGIDSDARARQERGQWHYEMVELGYNYRLPDLACALGLSQLKRLDANLARRREIAARYTGAFSAMRGVRPPAVRPGANPAWHLFPVRVSLPGRSRAEVFAALRAENIGVNVHYVPVHLHPYYRRHLGCKPGDFPVAESAYEQLISLPMFHGMEDGDVADVIAAVEKVVYAYGG
jgi:perosamine synthetase